MSSDTLSLHDALPISDGRRDREAEGEATQEIAEGEHGGGAPSPVRRRTKNPPCSPSAISCVASPSDRKSTRLNSCHMSISYAVFCLKKKTNSSSITE